MAEKGEEQGVRQCEVMRDKVRVRRKARVFGREG